jgi:hypothetical protein
MTVVVISGCVGQTGTQDQTVTQLPALISSNIEITKADWGGRGCAMTTDNCKSYKENLGGVSACGHLYVNFKVPSEVINNLKYTNSKLSCIYFLNGKRTPEDKNSRYEFNLDTNDIDIKSNLNLFTDNSIQLCCQGGWEGNKEPSACQTVILPKFCS